MSVFFFVDKKATDKLKRKVEAYRQQNNYAFEIEVLTLKDIIDKANADASIAYRLFNLCELWVNGRNNNYPDIIATFNAEANKRIITNKKSRKYIPDIYIQEDKLKLYCRCISDQNFLLRYIKIKLTAIQKSRNFEWLLDKKRINNDGTAVSFADCDFREIIAKLNFCAEDLFELNSRLKKFQLLAEYQVRLFCETSQDYVPIDEMYNRENNGLKWAAYEICELLDKVHDKQFITIIKEAGQGKTNFLCDFCDTFLFRQSIPVVYINVNELNGRGLKAELEAQIAQACGSTNAFSFTDQYFKAINKHIIVIIDGLNESANINTFYYDLLELYRFIDTKKVFKVIATSRMIAYQQKFSDMKTQSFGNKIVDFFENRDQRSDYRNDKGIEFRLRVFEAYKDYFKFSGTISGIAKEKLSSNVLLLRIFSEVNESATVSIQDIYLPSLFAEYLNKRAAHYVSNGKIKNANKLTALLLRIATEMNAKKQYSAISLDFSEEEKALIDIIVDEDILLKKEVSLTQITTQETYTFTYDEVRDYLVAQVIITDTDDAVFEAAIKAQADNGNDGVLRFLFIHYKENENQVREQKMTALQSFPKIYFNCIFHIKDTCINETDKQIILQAISDRDKYTISNAIIRTNAVFINLSSDDVVSEYLNNYVNDQREWERMFVNYDYAGHEVDGGILDEFMSEKTKNISADEIKRIVRFLCTFNEYRVVECIEKLDLEFRTEVRGSLDEIIAENNQLACQAENHKKALEDRQ